MSDTEKAKVLIVDDSPDNIDVLVEALNDDYQLSVAKDGMTALQIAQGSAPPDIILLDVLMPKMDGYEVCRQLKADPKTQGIPIIFITAQISSCDEIMGMEMGAVDYIVKPIRQHIVRVRIKAQLNVYTYQSMLSVKNQQLESAIEELNLTRDKLVRSERQHAVSNFISGIAHELGTPIGASITGVSICREQMIQLRQKIQDNALSRSALNSIADLSLESIHSIDNSLSAASRLLDRLRVLIDTAAYDHKSSSIETVIDTFMKSRQRQLQAGELRVELTLSEASELEVAAVPLFEILDILAENAVQHSLDEKQDKALILYLDVSNTPTGYQLQFHDNGIASNELDMSKLFDAFYTTKRGQGAKGLGLHVASILCERMNVSLDASVSEAGGLVFTLSF